jgi:hypothetical protein
MTRSSFAHNEVDCGAAVLADDADDGEWFALIAIVMTIAANTRRNWGTRRKVGSRIV